MAEVLFELGDWKLSREGEFVFAQHMSCVDDERWSWIRTDIAQCCWSCKEHVPDEIQAVLILYKEGANV